MAVFKSDGQELGSELKKEVLQQLQWDGKYCVGLRQKHIYQGRDLDNPIYIFEFTPTDNSQYHYHNWYETWFY